MRKTIEDRCGSVDYQKMIESQETLDTTAQSSHLLSCGGVYIPREVPDSPLKQSYQFISLNNVNRTVLVMKGSKLQSMAKDEMDPLWPLEGDEMRDQNPPAGVKKLLREPMN